MSGESGPRQFDQRDAPSGEVAATEASRPLATLSVPELLSPAFLKLQHADTHFTALGATIKSFLDEHPLELVPDPADQDGWRVVRLGETTAPPSEWGVLLGDGIHDCRSALDNAVAALVRLAGCEPTIANEFPIMVDVPASNRKRRLSRALTNVPSMYRGPILEAQPYLQGELARQHPLAVLQALSNADKHRLVHLATLAASEGQYRYAVEVGNHVVEHRTADFEPSLRAGTELFRLKIEPNSNAGIAAELEFSLVVGFAAGRGAATITTVPALADIYRYLWNLLASLIPFFANHVTVDLPSAIDDEAAIAELSLSHDHDGEQVPWMPEGEQETLTIDGVTRTYRRYSCPRCGASGYADVARQIKLR